MPRGKAGTGRCKPIFRGLNIAISGTFEGQWTDAKISRWVNLRAAEFSWRMSEDVTHLVCTKEEFEKKGPKVKEALKRAYRKEKQCHIVTLDWLEDSLFADRRLPEDKFSHVASLKTLQAKARLEKKIEKGKEEEKRSVNENFYHVYFDPTDCFQYEITLVRDDEEMGILGERYVVKLYESNALPHLYQVGVRYYKSKKDTIPKLHRLTDAPGNFWQEYEAFKRFFEIKVGYPWDERLVRGVGSLGNKFFSYQPPTGGKPVGWTPAELIPKEPIPPPAEAESQVNAAGSDNSMPCDQLPSPPNSQAEVDGTCPESVSNNQTSMDHTPKDDNTDHEALANPSQEGIQRDQTQETDQHPAQQHDQNQVTTSPNTPTVDAEDSGCLVRAADATLPISVENTAEITGEAVTVTVTASDSALQVVDDEVSCGPQPGFSSLNTGSHHQSV